MGCADDTFLHYYDNADKMLGTYFAKSLELRQTAIFADKLQDFSKDRRVYRRVCRQGAEFADKNFFQGGCDAPHAPHPDSPDGFITKLVRILLCMP